MKTITKKFKTFSFEELNQEARDKARQTWNESNDYPFLQDDLREYIHEELQELGFEVVGFSTSENPTIRPYYSLSYSQGDGLMFEGTVKDKKGNEYTIKHEGHYYHERSTEIEGTDKNGEWISTKDFEEKIYIPLCKKIAERGYDAIEYMESEESFKETCEANDYTFLEDGTMFTV